MRADVVTEHSDLAIRRMRGDEDDYNRMIEWRNLPHVRRWWDPDHPPLTLEQAREEYRPDTLPDAISKACIIELQGRAIGFVQFYRWCRPERKGADQKRDPERSINRNHRLQALML